MKKSLTKRVGAGPDRADLKKPFGFCCDEKSQDPETRYGAKDSPYKSSMENIFMNGGGPGLKFRIQDIGRSPYPIKWGGTHRIKSAASLGSCKRCRGPLQWYLEEEVAFARDGLAHKRQENYTSEMEKNVEIARDKREKKRRERLKKLKKGQKGGDEKPEVDEDSAEEDELKDNEESTKDTKSATASTEPSTP